MVIAGNDHLAFQGTQYAVNTVLERLGCGWFGPDPLWQVVPEQKTIKLPSLDIEHTPAFALRSVWNSMGHRWYMGGMRLQCGHALSQLFPPSEYYQEHPDFYPLIGGKRWNPATGGPWQLCTSNSEVIRLTIEKARRFFDEDPQQVMFSLSNNDCGGFCECEACAATGSSPGARMLAFANAVARGLRQTHPDKCVIFLAYWFTHEAPREEKMQAEPGVAVMVLGEGCHGHALTEPTCPRNRGWYENFEKWVATGARMSIYEWYIPGCAQHHWRRIPWVAGETAIRDQHDWRDRGVKWITYESQPAYEDGDGYPLRWPLYYVAAKGMWDASLSAEQILRDACEKLYGPAAEPMLAYYLRLAQAMAECPQHGNSWNLPDALTVYPSDTIGELRGHLAQAQKVAREHGGPVWERVQVDMRTWSRAQRALQELHQQQVPRVNISVNGKVYMVTQQTITGALIRSLGGIPAEEHVLLIGEDGTEQEIGDEEELSVVDGMRFRSVGE